MNFWLRKLIFGTVLSLIAFALLDNIDLIMEFDWSFGSDKDVVTQQHEAAVTDTSKLPNQPKAPVERKKSPLLPTENAAAEGLSKFYASINPSLAESGPKIRKGVVLLPKPKGNLEKLLIAKSRTTRPFPKNWRGTKYSRPFRKGHTLYQKLNEYAKEDGLELVWWLDKDLLIKDPFRVDKGILRTAFQIGQAMNGHFPNGVFTYFCYKQRDIVLIEGRHEYLDKNCRLLDFNQY